MNAARLLVTRVRFAAQVFAALSALGCARSERASASGPAADVHPPGASPVAAAEAAAGPTESARVTDGSREGGGGEAAARVSCIADAGAQAGSTSVVRVSVRAAAPRAAGCKGDRELALEVPALGLVRPLCLAGCGPFRFESHKDGPARVSFSCRADLLDTHGFVEVVDDVVRLEVASTPPAFADLPPEGDASAPPPSTNRAERIPLPCGRRLSLEASRPSVVEDRGGSSYP